MPKKRLHFLQPLFYFLKDAFYFFTLLVERLLCPNFVLHLSTRIISNEKNYRISPTVDLDQLCW